MNITYAPEKLSFHIKHKLIFLIGMAIDPSCARVLFVALSRRKSVITFLKRQKQKNKKKVNSSEYKPVYGLYTETMCANN